MLRFVVRRLGLDGVRDVRDQRAGLPDLLRHPGRRPRGAHRRPQRRPGDAGAVRKDFGLDRPLPVQYVLMMKQLFVSRDLESFVNRGSKVIPQVAAGGAGDALARHRRGGHLGGRRHRHGHRSRRPRAAARSTRCS